MAKKEQINNYPQEDLDNLMKLFKHVGPFYQEQQDLIFNMTRKYMDKNAPRPVASCGSCSQSFAVAFNRLRDWTMANANLFS